MEDDYSTEVWAHHTDSVATRRIVCQEVYNAFEFDRRVQCGQSVGFFVSFHKNEPVMVRKITVFDDDGVAGTGWFCVAFEEGTSNIRDAFAFTGKDDYFGQLPEGFVTGSAVDASLAPKWLM